MFWICGRRRALPLSIVRAMDLSKSALEAEAPSLEAKLLHLGIGNELRKVRGSKKLSLRSVAGAIGVSASLLSQVENGKTQPSVATLYALVNHLGISLDSLMGSSHIPPLKVEGRSASRAPSQDSQGSSPVVQRSHHNPLIEMENGVTWERLADGGSDVADPLIVTYEPGAASSAQDKLMRHSAIEYGCILEGQLTLKVDFDEFVLNPGDSFCFDANRPHRYQNNSDAATRGIWFVIGRREMAYKTLSDLGFDGVLTKASAEL